VILKAILKVSGGLRSLLLSPQNLIRRRRERREEKDVLGEKEKEKSQSDLVYVERLTKAEKYS